MSEIETLKSRRFGSVEDLLECVDLLAKRMPPSGYGTGRYKRTFKPLTLQVLELAPKHYCGFYPQLGIAREIASRQGIPSTGPEFLELRRKVAQTIRAQIARGRLQAPVKMSWYKRPALRKVTSEQVKKNSGVVHYVLRKGHKYLRRDWRSHLSYDEAFQIGRIGLLRALELADASKGPLGHYAAMHIASKVSAEVRKRRRQEPSIDPQRLQEMRETKQGDEEELLRFGQLRRLFELHSRNPKKVRGHHLVFWALNNLYGHSRSGIAKFFGLRVESVHLVAKRFSRLLE